jgi:hypothetical protein
MSWKIGVESRVASAPSVSSHPGNKVLDVKRSILHSSRITETTILLSCLDAHNWEGTSRARAASGDDTQTARIPVSQVEESKY